MKHLTTLSLALAIAASAALAQSAMPMSPAGMANEAAMAKMMDSMKMGMKMTGDADKDFVMMMLPHHQGAIDMAKVELEYGKDPMLKKMAGEIIAAQQKEIDAMKAWQSKAPM